MSREKSDLAKLLDGRCQGRGEGYSSWIHANEVGSDGSAFVIPDPVAKREVHVLSNAERIVFWQLRFDPEVYEIREQMLLYPKFIDEICEKHHYRKPKRMLTTDFLVEYHHSCKYTHLSFGLQQFLKYKLCQVYHHPNTTK